MQELILNMPTSTEALFLSKKIHSLSISCHTF